jgi:hypothetical protein
MIAVKDSMSGIVYPSAAEAARAFGVHRSTVATIIGRPWRGAFFVYETKAEHCPTYGARKDQL